MGSPLPCEQLEAPESVVSVVPMAEDVVAMVSVRDKVDNILSEIQLGSLLTHLEAAYLARRLWTNHSGRKARRVAPQQRRL